MQGHGILSAFIVAVLAVPASGFPLGPLPSGDGQEVDGLPVTLALPMEDLAPAGLGEQDLTQAATGPAAAAERAGGVGLEETDAADWTIVGLSEPIDTEHHDVYVVGVTWDADPGGGIAVDVRVRTEDRWGPWTGLEVAEAETDQGRAARAGSDPYVLTEAQDVQARVVSLDGQAVSGARLTVIGVDVTDRDREVTADTAPVPDPQGTDPGTDRTPDDGQTVLPGEEAPGADDGSGQEGLRTGAATSSAGGVMGGGPGTGVVAPPRAAAPDTAPVATGALPGQPTIRTRSAWGAVAPRTDPTYTAVRGTVVHHTAGANAYTADQVPATLRGIQNYHMVANGWNDIGYNFLVDRFGTVWEGRGGGIAKAVQGAHATGFNSATTGVSLMGNFETATVTDAALEGLERLLAWKLALHGVSAAGTFTVGGTTYPAIVGHRDVAATACPGATMYKLMSRLRSDVATLQRAAAPAPSPTCVPAPTGGATASAGARPTTSASATSNPRPTASASATTSGKATASAKPGVSASATPRATATASSGPLPICPATTAAPTATRTSAATTRATATPRATAAPRAATPSPTRMVAPRVTSLRDWDADGRPDLVAQARGGSMHRYRTDARGRVVSHVRFGKGWSRAVTLTQTFGLTGRKRADLIVVGRRSGNVYRYTSDGRGGTESMRLIARTWQKYDLVLGVQNLRGAGTGGIVVREKRTGTLWYYAATGRGGLRPRLRLPGNWKGMDAIVYAGDVDGDGKADLIGRSARTHRLTLYLGNGRGGFKAKRALPGTWGSVDSLVSGADWNGDGRIDLIARSTRTGALYLYRGTARGTFTSPTRIGTTTWRNYRPVG